MSLNANNAEAQMLRENIEEMPSLMDVFLVKGKVAVVTGGSSGLGFNVTARLLEGGANVVMASFSEQEGVNALAVLEEKGYGADRVQFKLTNVTSEDDMEALVDFADKTFGSIDILVTSAAVWSYAHVYDLPKEEFERAISVNLTGTFLAVKHVSKYMIEHGIQGKMCLVSSNSAWLPYPVFGGYIHYTASKGGVLSLTIEAAKELKRFGIKVNTVSPGGMATAGAMNNMALESLPEEKQDELYDEISTPQLDEIKTVDSVARVVYAMCTEFTDGITGERIVPDNGMTHNILSYQPEVAQYPE